jgi:23S rRNA (adenine2503-C2)-methyltransferase
MLSVIEPLRPRSAFDLTADELAAMGPPGSATVLLGRLHRVETWTEAGPVLGKASRVFVDANFDLALPRIVRRTASSDGATKLLLELHDGKTIEAVHMPRAVKNPRVTICVSTQVGCAMGCTFCNTAAMGLVRNLTAAEIVGQVLAVLRALGPRDRGRVSLVFMGMGEPLHNVKAVKRALSVLCDEAGLGLAPMRITVSTAGLVDGIRELAQANPRPCIALSLNATTDEARSAIMPIGKKHDLASLRAALRAWPARPHEKITLEYVLLAGKNDRPEDARRIADFAEGYRAVVNVIPWNPFAGAPFTESDEAHVRTFGRWLIEAGCLVTVRRSRGRDVGGACGQLATLARR